MGMSEQHEQLTLLSVAGLQVPLPRASGTLHRTSQRYAVGMLHLYAINTSPMQVCAGHEGATGERREGVQECCVRGSRLRRCHS